MKDQDYIPNMEGLPDDLYEAAREVINRSGNRKVDNGDGTRTISHSTCWLPMNIEAFVRLKIQEAEHKAAHFQHELQLLCEKVYAYAHMNKSAGYNGGDDKGREREPECGGIYEIAKSYLPYRHPHEKGLRKKLFPCAFSQCENETELHIDIWGKRQYVCEYHLSSIIDKLESDDTDL